MHCLLTEGVAFFDEARHYNWQVVARNLTERVFFHVAPMSESGQQGGEQHEEVVLKVTKRIKRKKARVNIREVLWESGKITGVVTASSFLLTGMTPRPFFYSANIGLWTFITAMSYTCMYLVNSCWW